MDSNVQAENELNLLSDSATRSRWELFHRAISGAKQENERVLASEQAGRDSNAVSPFED